MAKHEQAYKVYSVALDLVNDFMREHEEYINSYKLGLERTTKIYMLEFTLL